MNFDGHRVYNGAPDAALAARWREQDEALAKLKAEFPTAWCTWFPVECRYACAYWNAEGHYESVGGFELTKKEACDKALQLLRAQQRS